MFSIIGVCTSLNHIFFKNFNTFYSQGILASVSAKKFEKSGVAKDLFDHI